MVSSIIKVFANHKVAPNLLMLAMFLVGWLSLEKLNTQFFPDFAVDIVTVQVVWLGASAEEVQTSITVPLEQQLRNIANVSKVTSDTRRSSVVVMIEVDSGADVSKVVDDVKQQVDTLTGLPSDSEIPVVEQATRYDGVGTVLIVSDGPIDELINIARTAEQELLAAGISKVDFTGLPTREIAIKMRNSDLHDLGLSMRSIASLINNQSLDIMAGTAGLADGSKQLRAIGKLTDVQSFERLPLLTNNNAQLLRLGDIADVTLRNEADQASATYTGKPAIELSIRRMPKDDTLKTATIMTDWVKSAQERYPDSVEVVLYSEQWQLLKQRISLLVNNGLTGLILVVALLFLFLNSRVALWVAMGIPATLLAAWGVMFYLGGSINMISLFGMIMALGIIVDDAIVVGEDALSHAQRGQAPLEAALSGAKRMLGPVVASSLTTVAAFLPLLIVGGVIGNILVDIPKVVICVIVVSLIECFLILPGHLHHALKSGANKQESKWRRSFDRGFDRFRNGVFRPAVTKAIEYRWATFALAIAVFMIAISMLAGGRIQFTFFPATDGDTIRASVQFASGTNKATVVDFMEQVDDDMFAAEEELGGNLIRDRVIFYGTNVLGKDGLSGLDQIAYLNVQMDSTTQRSITNAKFISTWKDRVEGVPGLEKFIIDEPQSGPPGKPIAAQITGSNAEVMKAASLSLQDSLKSFAGVKNIDDNLPFGMEQYVFSLTPQAETLNLTTSDIGSQLRDAFDGIKIQSFFEGSDEIDVRLILADDIRDDINALYAFPIILNNGTTIPLLELVEFTSRRGIDKFQSKNGNLTVTVQADVDIGTTNANKVINKLQEKIIPDLEQKYGINVSFGGTRADQNATMADMQTGAMIGFALIYIVLAWVFGSYIWPLAVMFTIPFGITGAIFGHLLIGMDFTILSMFGLFGLSGIVINNSIVLLSFYKENREAGIEANKAIVDAACQRLRAVILTSSTTIAGLTPILFETSLQAQFLIPMATSIVFGLAAGTLLILFVVPSMIIMLENLTTMLKRTPKAPLDAPLPPKV